MVDIDERESRDMVLATARAAGFPVTDAQLARWHRAGLLAKPTVRSRGRGLGTESLYPAGTGARLVRIATVHAREHRLAYAAWRLWWEDGGPLSVPAREHLRRTGAWMDESKRAVADLVRRDAEGDPEAAALVDGVYQAAERGRLSGPLAAARKRTGTDRFSSVARVLLEIAGGSFTGYATDPTSGESADDEAIFENALGLTRARTDRFGSAGPWLEGETGPDLMRLASLMSSHSFAAAAATSDADLDAARRELRAFVEVISGAALLAARLFRPDAGAFAGIASGLAQMDHPRAQAFLLLAWSILGADDTLRPGMNELVGLAPRVEATTALFAIIEEIRIAVPTLGEAWSDERLGSAQGDAEQAAAMLTEIRDAAGEHRAEVDEGLARHPELPELIAAAEAEGEAEAVSG
jgi:hypothetical protein